MCPHNNLYHAVQSGCGSRPPAPQVLRQVEVRHGRRVYFFAIACRQFRGFSRSRFQFCDSLSQKVILVGKHRRSVACRMRCGSGISIALNIPGVGTVMRDMTPSPCQSADTTMVVCGGHGTATRARRSRNLARTPQRRIGQRGLQGGSFSPSDARKRIAFAR